MEQFFVVVFFFTVKLGPLNSFPSNTAEVRHIYLKLTVVFSRNFKDNFATGMQTRGDYKYLFLYLCFSIRN